MDVCTTARRPALENLIPRPPCISDLRSIESTNTRLDHVVKPSLYVQPLLLHNLHGLSSAYLAKPEQCPEADTTQNASTARRLTAGLESRASHSPISLERVYNVAVGLFLRPSRSIDLRRNPLS